METSTGWLQSLYENLVYPAPTVYETLSASNWPNSPFLIPWTSLETMPFRRVRTRTSFSAWLIGLQLVLLVDVFRRKESLRLHIVWGHFVFHPSRAGLRRASWERWSPRGYLFYRLFLRLRLKSFQQPLRGTFMDSAALFRIVSCLSNLFLSPRPRNLQKAVPFSPSSPNTWAQGIATYRSFTCNQTTRGRRTSQETPSRAPWS